MKYIPRIHPIIYDGIDHCICHSKPIKSEKYLGYIFKLDNRFIMVIVDEISMVRKPTNSKHNDDYKKHFYNLK